MAESPPDFTRIRLFVEDDLTAGAALTLGRDQSHYLANVMRRRAGDRVALFNGRDGEYRAAITQVRRGAVALAVGDRFRAQSEAPDLWLAFAPIKRAAVDFLAAKATELGVSRLVPVLTSRTNTGRVNARRLRSIAIEAAEQSERLTVPAVDDPVHFTTLLEGWPAERRLLVGDETGRGRPIAEVARNLGPAHAPCAVLTGPEGGFAPDELDRIRELPFVTPIGLGPRVLRADTAALAALSVVQAIAGDWRTGRLA